MRTSPPGKAHLGSMESICGLPFTFFVPVFRSIISTSRFAGMSRHLGTGTPSLQHHSPYDSKVEQQLQDDQGVYSRAQIVHHNSRAFRQPLQASHRRRLHNIEYPEKYKAGEQCLPHDGTRHKRKQLPRDLINYHMRGIFPAASARFQGGCRYADRYHQPNQQHDHWYPGGWR